MGLDQYLYARRAIDDAGLRQAIVRATASVTRYDDEDSLYLPRWSHSTDAERGRTDAVLALAGLTPIIGKESNSVYAAYDGSWVQVTACYWRKANAVHAWFVDHCQGGVDECQEAPVHPEQLAALLAACENALDAYRSGDLDKAMRAMEPRSGFFFGSTEIDQWWAAGMASTISEIRRVINAAIAIGGVEFVYQSSW
jgi:hypothetical protein